MQKHKLMDIKSPSCSPEIWGGIECTINRVGKDYLSQLEFSGFYNNEELLNKIISLGIKVLRYPVLWEQHQPIEDLQINWTKTAQQLETLQKNGIEPIAGLVHHGSGPSYTDLLDNSFPEKLAAYATRVAERFPWLEYYTPVNEPLTTARFSGLYGIWYPHHSSDQAFLRMLVNQLKGVVLSMQSIRKINPSAKLVQTEDLGKTYSTPLLQYQADFENARRWLTYDFLCGKVDKHHPLYLYLLDNGLGKDDIQFFLDNPCIPYIAGFNHYITSERFLDDRLYLYPLHMHGGNGQHQYVDTEAVRVCHEEDSGLSVLLNEAWKRYELPMALTEVHLHCTREEQLRWFMNVYQACTKLNEHGLNIKAITAWSIFGAYGWNKLLSGDTSAYEYEPGVFDLRSSDARPTALAQMIRNLAGNKVYKHPLLLSRGWWKRDIRYIYGVNNYNDMSKQNNPAKSSPLLIIGKRGTLGKAFARLCELRGIHYRLLSREDLDICNKQSIEKAIETYRPWAIVNAAGFVRVDDAEIEISKCFQDNTSGPAQLAITCSDKGIQLVSFSSDLVFDGSKQQPYLEADQTSPLNVYGQSKADKERLVSEIFPDALIIRTSSFFSPWDPYNFVHHVLTTLNNGLPFEAVDNIIMSPTFVPDLVHLSLDLLIDEEKGIWHVANDGAISWYDLAREAAARAGMNIKLVKGLKDHEMNWKAARPLYSVLKSSRGTYLPTLENALDRYFREKNRQDIPMAV